MSGKLRIFDITLDFQINAFFYDLPYLSQLKGQNRPSSSGSQRHRLSINKMCVYWCLAKYWIISAYRITQYRRGVHPSMVIHWNTVNMAKRILSNDVIPKFGPWSEESTLAGWKLPYSILPAIFPGRLLRMHCRYKLQLGQCRVGQRYRAQWCSSHHGQFGLKINLVKN